MLPRLAAAAFLVGLPAFVAAQPAPRPGLPVNALSLPVVDASGSRVVYTRDQIGVPGPVVSKSTSSSPCDPDVQGLEAFWSYAAFGRNIGGDGLVIARAAGQTEIYATTTNGSSSFFYALRYDPAAHDYVQTYVSRCLDGQIARLAVGDVAGNGRNEIVVALYSGEVILFDQDSKARLASFPTANDPITGMTLKDLDGDGKAEVILVSVANLYVYSGTGVLLWEVDGHGGYDVVAGQMDSDPAIEIATTSGAVIDSATHAVQWQWSAGFGRHLAVGDIDGDGIEELIAAQDWYFVWAYDVERQLPKWSIPIYLDIGAILLADVDCDGTPDLLVGQGQWGYIQAFDTRTQLLKWQISNPEHGVTRIAVGDVDGDGITDVLWGAGYTSTGPDRLFVADVQSRVVKWSNLDLVGPFLGPVVGDLDGDGRNELVTASWSSDSGYASGRIFVFDSETRKLRAISPPVVSNAAWTGVHDLKLAHVYPGSGLQIVIASGYVYDGVIEIYSFDGTNDTFQLKWTNADRPYGATFYSVEVADLNHDGHLKVVGGTGREHTGAEGVFVYVYDLDTNTIDWRTFQLGGYWDRVTNLSVFDFTHPEIVAQVDGGDVYVFDAQDRMATQIITGPFTTMAPDLANTFRTGNPTGDVVLYFNGPLFMAGSPEHFFDQPIDGYSPLSVGRAVGTEGRLLYHPGGLSPIIWQTVPYGLGFGRHAVEDRGDLRSPVYTSGIDRVVALAPPLTVTAISPASGTAVSPPLVAVSGNGFGALPQVLFGSLDAGTVTPADFMHLSVQPPALVPGTLYDLEIRNRADVDRARGTLRGAFFADFLDVPAGLPYHDFVERLARARVTGGCGGGRFCPSATVTRAQWSVFLLLSRFTADHLPPPGSGLVFTDVPCGSFAAAYIEELARLGVVAGCGGGGFCPSSPVTRAQAAVTLLRTKHGITYAPPPPTGTVFSDVPATAFAAAWIEELAVEGISGGCGGGRYCPDAPVTRAQAAVFAALAFSLP